MQTKGNKNFHEDDCFCLFRNNRAPQALLLLVEDYFGTPNAVLELQNVRRVYEEATVSLTKVRMSLCLRSAVRVATRLPGSYAVCCDLTENQLAGVADGSQHGRCILSIGRRLGIKFKLTVSGPCSSAALGR